ncbi:ATP-dependent RNA helicase DDX58 [Mytilus galloprovincialis]|uniref:ATP-dependent RNA helicase DDX58 n=1 Tax=Mytilus galloprovincialis TaxID=29158 RepID=A0A8B6BWE4_MYTGA|nr:ATP-dependent RNA helicase DDX58 [Mytilus galloprovincialis]
MNIPIWRKLLNGYYDYKIVDFLEFGWPVGYSKHESPETIVRNHKSALFFSEHIDEYINKELSYNALVDPFKVNPFQVPLTTSPLSSVPKKATIERRTIMDLSLPIGTSVNDGIPKHTYMGDPFTLHYPATDHLVQLINEKGPNCLLYKVDIKRCYRWLPVDPYDYHLLGLVWNHKLYFDTKIPFGLRTGAMTAQRTTNAIMYMYRNMGYNGVNYIDDIGSAETTEFAGNGFHILKTLIDDLGFKVAEQKCCAPDTNMIFLGKQFDTVNMTISIPNDKLYEIKGVIEKLLTKKTITKKKLESIIGKLSYIADCIRLARLFIARLLALFRTISRKGHHINLNGEAKKDLNFIISQAKLAFFANFPTHKCPCFLSSLSSDLCACHCVALVIVVFSFYMTYC